MKIVGNLAEWPDARFTPHGEYRVYLNVRVTETLVVECILKGTMAEEFLNALPGVDALVVGMRVAIRGVETIRRYRKFDGGSGVHSYINATELVCKIDGEPTRFSNDL